MKPALKFQGYILVITTIIIFFLWELISQIPVKSNSIKILIGGLTTLGTYKLIVQTFLNLTRQVKLIKKFVLGASYLEGTWCGYYIGASGKPRFFVESFEQDIDKLIIRGSSITDIEEMHATWITTAHNIDSEKGQLTYMYEVFGLKDNSNNYGITVLNFERENQYKPANKLVGYFTDISIGKRITYIEYKQSDNCSIPFEEGIKKAKEIYKNNLYK